jgi:predicted transcriptional regulator
MPPEIGIDAIISHEIEMDPPTTTRELALSLGVSPQIVINHLQHDLKMKRSHLAGVTKDERVRCVKIKLDGFDVHARTDA